jgi:hypothetical protein
MDGRAALAMTSRDIAALRSRCSGHACVRSKKAKLLMNESAAQQLSQLQHIPRMKIVARLRRYIFDLRSTKLQRALDVRGWQAAGAGGGQVIVVRSAEHDLLGRRIEDLCHA